MTSSRPFNQDELDRLRKSDQSGNIGGTSSKLLANLDECQQRLGRALNLIRPFTAPSGNFSAMTRDPASGDWWCYVCDASCPEADRSTVGIKHEPDCPVPGMMELVPGANLEAQPTGPVDSAGSRHMGHAGS